MNFISIFLTMFMKTEILLSAVSAKALLVVACLSSSNDSSSATTVAGSFVAAITHLETATTATEVAEAVAEDQGSLLFSAGDQQGFSRG